MLFRDSQQLLAGTPSKMFRCHRTVEDQPLTTYTENDIRSPTCFATGKQPNPLLRSEVVESDDLCTRPLLQLLEFNPAVDVVHIRRSRVHGILYRYGME